MSFSKARIIILPSLIIFLIGQFIISPFICVITYNGISEKIFAFYNSESSVKDRTLLLENLMVYPVISFLLTFVCFTVGSIFVFFLSKSSELSLEIKIINLMEYFCGSYFAALFAHKFTMNSCTEVATDIAAAGVDHDYVMNRKFFGSSMLVQIFLYIIIPLFFTGFANVAIVFAQYENFFSSTINTDFINSQNPGDIVNLTSKLRMLFTCTFNAFLELTLTFLFYKSYSKNTKTMTQCLENIKSSNLSGNENFPTSIADEFGYSLYLSNKMIEMFRKKLNQSYTVANAIKASTDNLVLLSNESSTISIEQSTATQELSRTMDSVKNLSHNIEERINEVSSLAQKTSSSVKDGSVILNKNISKMSEIVEANKNTIDGVRNLNEKINTIWEILKLINTIADQTKIIAFNAELESSRSSKENKNFKNVADEIRRLTNSIVTSTKEIREKISSIKFSSDSLIQSSEECSKLINDGKYLIRGLETSLEKIQVSAGSNSANSQEINEKVNTQTEAFENIASTIAQINTSVQTYSVSTQIILDEAKALLENAKNLEETANLTVNKNFENSDSAD